MNREIDGYPKAQRRLADFECMRPREAAAYIGLSESKLAKLRMRENRENGPNYIKCGGVVIYRKCDLDSWLSSMVVGKEGGRVH